MYNTVLQKQSEKQSEKDNMNISKALKLKNRLAGEITRLKGIVVANNSLLSVNHTDYDVKNIFEVEIQQRVRDLVTVKTVIACSNGTSDYDAKLEDYASSPFWAIFMMAELKGLIQTLNSIDTKHGYVVNQYEPTAPSVEYVATYTPKDIDRMVMQYQSDIDQLQDYLDTHNVSFQSCILDDIKF